MQADNFLTDAGGRLIAEYLKGNYSVTEVWVSVGLLFVRFLLLTCVGQCAGQGKLIGKESLSEIDAITKRNMNEPEQRRAEVAAIKQVFRRLCAFFASFLCVMFTAAVL